MKQKLKVTDNQLDTSPGEHSVAEEDPLATQETSEPGIGGVDSNVANCYDKSISFFDSISCESTQPEGNRCVCVCLYLCVCVFVCVRVCVDMICVNH